MLRPSALTRRTQLRKLADEELMELVAAQDAAAFEVMFDCYGGAAFSLAYRMCGQRAVAEDIVQEAFLSLWRQAARFDHRRGSLRAFVLGVVRNRAIDSFRARATRERLTVPDDGVAERLPADELTDAEVGRRDEAEHVRNALRELPDDQRRVIELAYFGGYTHQQIAELLALPPGTVKGRMRLGLTKLRSSLGELADSVL
jgi:RNA polymerase sigma-70 factor (ECF subfamily)